MKRLSLAMTAAVGLLLGCLAAVPPELIDARLALDRAENSQTRTLAPDEFERAQRSLRRAESEYQRAPHSKTARDLAYVAHRRVQLAESKARLELAKRDRAAAEQQLAASRSQTASELSEARARLQAQEQERRRLETEQASRARQEAEARAAREQQEQRDQLSSAQARLDEQQKQLEARQREVEEARRQQANAEASQRAALQELERFAKVQEEQRGTVITLPGGLLFPPGRSDLTADSQRALERVAEALKAVPEQHLVIEGHTDGRGAEDVNYELSRFRAMAVKDFLASHGVERERIEAVGFGETRPIASNASAEGRASNRRVEIVVQRGVGGSGEK